MYELLFRTDSVLIVVSVSFVVEVITVQTSGCASLHSIFFKICILSPTIRRLQQMKVDLHAAAPLRVPARRIWGSEVLVS